MLEEMKKAAAEDKKKLTKLTEKELDGVAGGEGPWWKTPEELANTPNPDKPSWNW